MVGMVAAVVLAAGAGRRFGGPKQLAPFRGRPLLEHALDAASAAPVDDVVVVLGAHAPEILAAVALSRARPVLCEGWQHGQAAALRAGLLATGAADAVVVLLGDQPLVSPRAVERLIARRDGSAPALRATYAGVAGHPVLIERPLFAQLLELRGDRGARDVLARVDCRSVACDGLGCAADVDTPAALERLARQGSAPGRPPAR